MAKVRGRFPDVNGEVHIAEVPAESTLEVEIDASTIDTRTPTATPTCGTSAGAPAERSQGRSA